MASSDGALDFEEAMRDFRVMFPDMEADVIEAVLRAHGGGVDATIDHLLAMSSSANEGGETGANKPLPSREPPMEDLIQLGPSLNLGENILDPLKVEEDPRPKALAYSHPERALEEENPQQRMGVVPTPQMLQNRYEENLRNRERVRTTGAMSEPSLSQYLEDERVALMLQNEEFMAELRRDQEFISTLESESTTTSASPPNAQSYSFSPKTSSKISMDEAIFREKLKNMGKTSKKKFSQLASMFSRRKNIAKNMLGNSSAPSNDNLLLDAESLVNEDDDSEEEKPSGASSMFHTKSKGGGKYSSFS